MRMHNYICAKRLKNADVQIYIFMCVFVNNNVHGTNVHHKGIYNYVLFEINLFKK